MSKKWLIGKTVVITGASGGLGFNVAKLLIEKYDCKIIGIARNEQKMLKNIETLGNKKANFSYRIFDVSLRENWLEFYNYLTLNNISIDILINNAGFMLPFSKFTNYTDSEIDEIVNTNFMSVVYSTKILFDYINKSPTPAIINISSAAGRCIVVGQSMYCATKFAVRAFTETLQQDFKGQLYLGGVYPGFIRTDILNRKNGKDKANKLVNALMMPVEKASKKIVKGIAKKKKHIAMGLDGRSMSFFSRVFPRLTPTIIRKVLKISKLDLFSDVFD